MKFFKQFVTHFLSLQVKKKAQVMAKHDIAKKLKKMCLKGEADRFIGDLKPKQLFSGK